MNNTEERKMNIMKQVARRSHGVIEECLIKELEVNLNSEVIKDFLSDNNIVIGLEERKENRITFSEEATYILQSQKDNNKAISVLTTEYMDLLKNISQKASSDFGMDKDDAFQESWIILYNTLIHNIDLEKVENISGFLREHIYKELMRTYQKKYHPINIDSVIFWKIQRINKYQNENRIEFWSDQEIENVSKEVGITFKLAKKYIVEYIPLLYSEISLDSKVNNSDDCEITISDMISGNENIEEYIQNKEIINEIYNIINDFSNKDKTIVMGYLEGKTHQKIAEEVGLHRPAVTIRLNNIFNQIRAEIGE